MSGDNKHNKDDISLFREATQDARPLQQDKIEPVYPRPAPIPKQSMLENERVLQDMISDHYDPAEIETGEELLFSRTGLQHGLIKKLRRGQFSIRGELDMHGMTVAEAREQLFVFLDECQKKHARCVRIVHGKGNGSPDKIPVLKSNLNRWLRQIDDVLAFCSARQVDGGTGAVYVLLKQR